MDRERLVTLMDHMVRFAISMQEAAGIDVISDGEWRRIHYTDEFLHRIGGFKPLRPFHHQGETKYSLVVVSPIESGTPVFSEDGKFLAAGTSHLTKFAIPSPFLIAIRYWHEDFSREAYPTRQSFMTAIAAVLAREAEALASAGIDILQIDDPALTYFCDPRLTSGQRIHDERLDRRWDAGEEVPRAVEAINTVAGGLEAVVHLHCCHSVYHRMSDVKGNYKPLLPLLRDLAVDQVNLEFAYAETGDIDDLRLLPDHLKVGMGVVDVRRERPTTVEEITGKVERALHFIEADRISLNPDCGFAPDAFEPPTIDEAFEKLRNLATASRILRERHG
jgi:5-methyltetrahydropteroyltriglutamate--homocysteine methyltransferase